jgi:hypothetical protein
MPVTPPPAVTAPAPADTYAPASAMIARERQAWLVPLRPRRRAAGPCPEAKGSEIVVCAPREDDPARDRLGAAVPEAPTAMEALKRKMTVSLGPVHAGPAIGVSPGIPEPAPYVGVKVGVKF